MTNIHYLSYLAQFFLEWEKFHITAVDEIKDHILYLMAFFSKNVPYIR
jgi:hypothetical protein